MLGGSMVKAIPELGQALYGNPCGEYDAGDLGRACLMAAIDEIGRVFGNREQRTWDGYEDPGIDGVEFRPYYWGDDDAEAEKPNLAYGGIEIRWYKHPGRGTTVQREVTPDEWATWLTSILRVIQEADEE